MSVVIGSVTLTENLKVRRLGAEVSHKLVTFDGMSGQEAIKGSRIYESYAVSADISGASVAAVDTAAIALEAALYNLVGASTSTVTITYGDGSSTTVNYAILVDRPDYSPPHKRDTSWFRTVSFVIRRLR